MGHGARQAGSTLAGPYSPFTMSPASFAALLLLSAAVRVVDLDRFGGTVFDEYYDVHRLHDI